MATFNRRVVVTGLGMSTPLGATTEASWAGLVAGKSGIRTVPEWVTAEFGGQKLPVSIAGLVPDFDATAWFDEVREVRRTERFIHLAHAAALQAWRQAGLPPRLSDVDAERAGCILGVGLGGLGGIVDAQQTLVEKGPRRVSPFFIPSTIANLAPGTLSIRFNLRAANWAVASACTSGAHGIGESFMHIASGRTDLMLCGGAEACCEPVAIAGFATMQAICKDRNHEPERASRPFERDRSGFVLGEGAGVMVLEEYERARQRGATMYAEVLGYGSSADAFHITAPPPEGAGAQRAFREALRMANLDPTRVTYINAHGTSTMADQLESEAIKAVYGEHARRVMVSSTKSMTGHLLGGAGGVEGVISVLALHHGVVPPTINLDEPDPACDLDYVPHTARQVKLDVVQSNSFGFGGTNGVLLFGRPSSLFKPRTIPQNESHPTMG